MDLIIKNGTIVTPFDEYKADIGVKSGKVVAIAECVEDPAKKVIDAEGKYIFPGIIDMHTHIDHWGGSAKTEDDFFTGTRAAALGGVTTLIDFAIQQKGETVAEAVSRRRQEADGMVCIDYSLHCHVTNANSETLATLQQLIADGYPSIKLFTTYRKAGFKIEDDDCITLMKKVTDNGGLVMIHAENDSMCESITQKFIDQNVATPINYPDSRPNLAEAECISRMILFAEHTGASIYFAHVSTSEGLQLIVDAKERGVKVIAETCPHYLLLTRDKYKESDGYKYIMAPPLRESKDLEALWEGLRKEAISIVSSDHCAFSVDKKVNGKENFSNVSPGIHGIELLLPLMYEFGVNTGKISKRQLVKSLCYNPAKIFGLYPQKGTITVGSDADLVVFDPTKTVHLEDDNHNMASDFSPYKGLKVNGYPSSVISKGCIVVNDGKFEGSKGAGKFVKRKIEY